MKSGKNAAFTLLELLLSLVIVATLVTLGLTAINQVRGSSNEVICTANFRQIHVGLMNYAGDNAGFLPRNRTSINAWFQQLFPTYICETKIFHCREDRAGFAPSSINASRINGKVSYGPVAVDNAEEHEVSPFDKRLAAFSQPAVSVLLSEAHVKDCQLAEIWFHNSPSWPSRVAYAHRDHANVLFLDGHVSSMLKTELTYASDKKTLLFTFRDIPNRFP